MPVKQGQTTRGRDGSIPQRMQRSIREMHCGGGGSCCGRQCGTGYGRCERSEVIHLSARCGIDCSASFAERRRGHDSVFSRHEVPELCIIVALQEDGRAQGTPDAGRTREPCVQKRCTLRTQATTGQPGQPAFPARWVTAYTSSPRRAGLSSRRPAGRLTRRLTPASGGRDPTISPSAARASSVARLRVHRIPPRVRDEWPNAPLAEAGRRRPYA